MQHTATLPSLLKKTPWVSVALSEGEKLVGCKWVYTLKYKDDMSIEQYKAVVKGFTQTYRNLLLKDRCSRCKDEYSPGNINSC